MRQDEREAFEAMPDEMTVYRGSAFPDRYGISWTLDRDIAAKFARRFHRESYLLTAKIKKSDVHVYLGRRNEREIIVERFDVLQRKAVWG